MKYRWSLKIGAHRGTQVGTTAVKTADWWQGLKGKITTINTSIVSFLHLANSKERNQGDDEVSSSWQKTGRWKEACCCCTCHLGVKDISESDN